jgi:signal transduction histidine kinase
MLIAGEVLRAVNAMVRAQVAEAAMARGAAQATLGRYILEMRHSLNDALTSVLGNSELLLAQPGTLSGNALEQIETIRNMSVRIHEILQRFSSLETELRYTEKQPGNNQAHAASAGA